MRTTPTIPAEDISRQLSICDEIHAILDRRPGQKKAFVDTYGCQQNVADSQRIMGMLRDMGCGFTDDPHKADIIVINTCAIT